MTDRWELDRWVDAMRGRGLSEHTIRQRHSYVARFAAWHDTPTDVTPDDIDQWMADHPDWRPETRKAARGALSAYFRWMTRTGRLTTSPVEQVEPARIPPAAPHPVPEDVLHTALEQADPHTRMMLLLGAYAGLRRSEIATITGRDLEGPYLRVRGKGGRVRMVPAHPRIVAHWPPPWDGISPSPDQVARRMKAALGNGWTTHSLRHRFATRLFRSTENVLLTQQLLGHSSPVTTQRYVAMPEDAAVTAIRGLA